MPDSNTSLFRHLRLYCQVSALATMGVGLLVLFGWAFHIGTLLSVFPGHVTMKVNTALGLEFGGMSLWLLLPGESRTRRGKIARFLALVVVLIGVATLIEYFFSLNLGIDQLIFSDPLGSSGTSSPGRLAPTTATAFIAIGLALMLLDSNAKRIRWTAQALSLWSGLIAIMAINGYLYHAVVLSRIWLYTQVAMHTAVGLLLLSGGVFFARPRSGIAGDLTGEGSGSLMARRLLPAVFLVPIVLGWIALQGEFARLYGAELGLALYATASVLVFAILVWSNARKMNGEYDQRSRAEIDIRELNTRLEGRVAERTKHLAEMEGRYRGLLEAAPDAMVVVNVRGDIVLLNVQAEKQFGYHRDELIGQKVKNIIPEGFAERIIADGTRSAAEALAQQIGTGIELIGRRKDGSEFPIEIMLSPLESAEGVLVTAAIRDISMRRTAETNLAQMEGRYRGLLEAAPDAMVVVNVDGEIVLLNVQAEIQFGYRRNELVGQKIRNIIPEGFAERLVADGTRSAAAALAQQIGTGIELSGRRKNGTKFPIEIMLSPLESAEGILVTAAIRDISVRRAAETNLAQMEGRYRGLLEAAPDAMVVVNVAGEIVLLNVRAEKEFGYKRDELIGQKVKNIIPVGFAERIIADGTRSAAEALAQQIGTGIELIGRRKDGSEFPIEIMLSPLESPEGILVTAAIRDISVRRTAETSLAQMEGRYRGLLEAAPDAMVVVNVAGEIVLLNVRAEKEFGYNRNELVGQKVKNIIPEGFAERLIADGERSAAEALAQQIGTGIELSGRRKNGSEFPIEIMLSPLESPDGILVTAAIRDISVRKAAEADLLQKIDELNVSNEELGKFAYIASHDLQEPLRMVASYTQLLSRRYKGKLDAEADEFIAFAVDGANRMQRLIQDLLSYSRVGTKGQELLDTSSEEALQRALVNLRAAVEESGAVVTHDPLPTVLADGMQLIQMFQNLIGNAIKYQKPGVPRVHVSAVRNGAKQWTFSVKDNGLGIEPQYFERIFGMFQRLHKREEFAGTGIGLAICKKIAERHGGSISVQSEPGQGSTFSFALDGVKESHASQQG
ncbi:MAG: PAS domain S-box protein [Candidatus Sulfotelmatobacter sp.]|jgi:PAS domain S-box-containing protein